MDRQCFQKNIDNSGIALLHFINGTDIRCRISFERLTLLHVYDTHGKICSIHRSYQESVEYELFMKESVQDSTATVPRYLFRYVAKHFM